ncbi:alpha/beta hydrolase [Parenemella sanctibonifatiensis]|uniref:Alpha/beta hydrolase n=1 Tax=Parenemella sanctibonifatiensis TaxID=2016505 RepID=A0A255EHX4_9ACTN|nr:alpha/beta hydrolase [Parenemella sanctibonifatiensis]OYN91124.1 hypothetical protein CGZ91_06595 [Parenemella sanctibonifatiensis]
MRPSDLVRRLIYPVPVWLPRREESIAALAASTTTDNGTVVLHHRAPEGAATVTYLHGNGSDLSTIGTIAQLLRDSGLGFAAFEYPGYGPHAGEPRQAAILAAARDGLAHLRGAGVSLRRTVLVGESLGSSVAAHLAAEGQLRSEDETGRLVLISPFTNMAAMVRRYTRLDPRGLVSEPWATDVTVRSITEPTLVIHGAKDTLVPPAMSRRLAAELPRATRIVVPDRKHDNLWEPPSECLAAVVDFARSTDTEATEA